ncbi:MAG: hypothetical protein IKS48_05255 [Eubacterium sp.]|nr:hypothetical protein [Eubacterium sp.]
MSKKMFKKLLTCLALVSFTLLASVKAEANTITTATSVPMDKTVTGKLSSEKDIQYYKFTTGKNSYCVFSFVPNGSAEAIESGWNITILDSNYKKLFGYNRVDEAFRSVRMEMPAGTVFYVKVEAYYNDYRPLAPVGVSYSLQVSQTNDPTWEKEKNDTKKTANALTEGKPIYGITWKGSDVDYYKYKLKKNGYAQFTFVPEDVSDDGLGWNVTFFDKNMKTLAKYNRVDEEAFKSIRFNLKKGSTIYVKVEAYNSEIYSPINRKYSLSVKEKATKNWENPENNNSFSKATRVKSVKTGTILYSEDVDYFKVKTTKAKKRVKFVIKGDSEMVGHGYEIKVYDSSKKEIKRLSDHYITEDKSYRFKPGKVYYFKVTSTYPGLSGGPIDVPYSIKLY